MKKTELFIASEGFLFLALTSFINEDYLISSVGFTLSALLAGLLIASGDRRKTEVKDMLIVFLVQLLITLSTFSFHTLIPCLMVTLVSVGHISALQTLSRGCQSRIRALLLPAIALVFAAVLASHFIISAVFHTKEVMALSYLPMLAMLSVPCLYQLASGLSLHNRRLMEFH